MNHEETPGAGQELTRVSDYFLRLGMDVERRFRSLRFDERRFSQAAMGALLEAPPHLTLSCPEVLRWGVDTCRLPAQTDPRSLFGEPPLTVYRGDLFHIDVNVWLNSTTSIHEHSFSGAFSVLSGSSVHTSYRFEVDERVNGRLQFGTLSSLGSELLLPGATRPIEAGSRFIHYLYHLDHPSLTVVVRTYSDPGTQPQYDYLPPSLAIDPAPVDVGLKRRLECLAALARHDLPAFLDAADSFLLRGDLHASFLLLQQSQRYLRREGEAQQRIKDCLSRIHGELARRLDPVLDEYARLTVLAGQRFKVSEPDHRFFFALLLNVRSRHEIFRMISDRMNTNDPARQICRWIEEIKAAGKLNLPLGAGHLAILEGALRDEPAARSVARLRQDFDTEDSALDEARVLQIRAQLARDPMLHSLFLAAPQEVRS
jgi:hypothetical protein